MTDVADEQWKEVKRLAERLIISESASAANVFVMGCLDAACRVLGATEKLNNIQATDKLIEILQNIKAAEQGL